MSCFHSFALAGSFFPWPSFFRKKDGVLYTPRVRTLLLQLLQQRETPRSSNSSDASRSSQRQEPHPKATTLPDVVVIGRCRCRFGSFVFVVTFVLAPAPLHGGHQERRERALRGHADGTFAERREKKRKSERKEEVDSALFFLSFFFLTSTPSLFDLTFSHQNLPQPGLPQPPRQGLRRAHRLQAREHGAMLQVSRRAKGRERETD